MNPRIIEYVWMPLMHLGRHLSTIGRKMGFLCAGVCLLCSYQPFFMKAQRSPDCPQFVGSCRLKYMKRFMNLWRDAMIYMHLIILGLLHMYSSHKKMNSYQLQSNFYLRTQLVKNDCTYCKKYLNRGIDSHRLTCEVVWLVNDLSQKIPKLHEDLKENVNRNQTLMLNEVDLTVKWSWSHQFLFSQ